MWPSGASNALYAQCNDCMQACVCHTRPYVTQYAHNECFVNLLTSEGDFLLKTGLKSDFGPVEPEQGVAKSNRGYAVSSDR
jgi:hypothetical protein